MRLNNGLEIPQIGVGTWTLRGETARQNVAFMMKSIRLGLQQFGSPKIQEELTETHYIR